MKKIDNIPPVFLSGVVVLTPPHLKFLTIILSDLTNQTLAFSEILIVSSGFEQEEFDLVVAQVKDFDDKPIRVIRAAAGSAGRNRNIGLDAVSDEAVLVMMHDADDRYTNFRNQVIYDQFLRSEFDALLHLFLPTTEFWSGLLLENLNCSPLQTDITIITPKELFEETFRSGRSREEEALAIIDTSLKLPKSSSHLLVTHGHVTLQRATTKEFRYHENFLPRNEDGLLVRDLLFSGLRVFVLGRTLSIYLAGTSSYFTKPSKYQLSVKFMRLLYKKFVGSKKAFLGFSKGTL